MSPPSKRPATRKIGVPVLAALAMVLLDPVPGAASGVLLVDVNREARELLGDAAAAIEAKDYDKAVALLHSVAASEAPSFIESVDLPNVYGSAPAAARRMIGTLPPDVLAAYRKRFEAPARRRFEIGREHGDDGALRRVAREHFHTVWGAKALNRLAALAFDREDYLEAGHAWMTLYAEHGGHPFDHALLLTKAAVAYHLGEAPGKAAAVQSLLERQHADATAVVAGRKATLLSVVRDTLKLPAARRSRLQPLLSWTSASGTPDGVAVMSDCPASSLPLWKEPEARQRRNTQALFHRLGDGGARLGDKVDIDVVSGRVRLSFTRPGEGLCEFDLPAIVHPVVADDRLVCRREQGLVALDVGTGQERWTFAFPVHDLEGMSKTANHYLPLAGDMGRHTVTLAEGRLYAVGRFRRIDPETYRKFGASTTEDTSTLIALSLDGRAVLWEIGHGKGDHEVTRGAKYLAAPTYGRGRLYVPAKVANRYRVLCLDAASGALVWNTAVGPIPTHTSDPLSWQAAYTMELMTERASPVAVSGGRVYVTSNAGIVAALDADSGTPVWAHRYDSRVSGSAGSHKARDVASLAFLIAAARRPFDPQNPLVVTKGRVVALPCDSDAVLAFHAVTGELLWKRSRRACADLTAVDEDTLLLSGPACILLKASDGSAIREIDVRVHDRPAVTRDAIIGAGEGRIVAVDLADYAVDEQAIEGRGAVLGRMVAVRGRLVAVNAAGAGVYLGFDDAWGALSSELEQAETEKKTALHQRRGVLAFRAGRLALSGTEFETAETLAKRAGDTQALAAIRPWRHRILLQQAKTGADERTVGKCLDDALEYADSDEEKLRTLEEQIRCQERFGRPDRAVETAQDLSERFATVRMPFPDTVPGSTTFLSGYLYGQSEIGRLIAARGRKVYRTFDKKLDRVVSGDRQALDTDVWLAAQRRWPHAERCDELLFAVAERLYAQAAADAPLDRVAAMRASRVLGEIGNYPRSKWHGPARIAQLLIDSQLRPGLSGVGCADAEARGLKQTIRFHDFEGAARDAAQGAQGRIEDADFAHVASPVEPLFRSEGRRAAVLRDPRGRPLTVGERILLRSSDVVTCVDAHRNTYRQSRLWTLPVPATKDFGRRFGQVTLDRRRVAVVDPKHVIIADTVTGREVLAKPLKEFGIGAWSHAAADGDHIVLADSHGTLSCIDIAEGRRSWERNIRGLQAESLDAAGGMLSARASSDRTALVLDIRTGRSLLEVSPRNWAQAWVRLNADGFAAVLTTQHEFFFHDPRLGDRGLLRRTAQDDLNHELVAFGHRFAALRSKTSPHVLRFFDITGESKPVDVSCTADGKQALPVAGVCFSGSEAVALCTRPGGIPGMLRSPWVMGLDLPSGDVLWRVPLARGDADEARVSMPCIQGDLVSVLVTPKRETRSSRCIVIDRVQGTVVVSIDGDGGAGNGAGIVRSPEWAHSPVVLNGRLMVEQDAGVLCLRSRL